MSILAQTIIDNAMRMIGVLASGETPTATERNDGLLMLNQLMDSWSAMGVGIPYLSYVNKVLNSAVAYTIGPSQDINTARPLVIQSASVVVSGVERPVEIVTAQKFTSIPDKTRTGKFAEVLFYQVTSPTIGTIYIWPAASGSTLQLYSLNAMTQFADLATTAYTFPPGYERAITAAMALEMASDYGQSAGKELIANLTEAKNAIFNLNAMVLGANAGFGAPPPPAEGQ